MNTYAMPLCPKCGIGVELGKVYCDACRIEARRESWRVSKWKARGKPYIKQVVVRRGREPELVGEPLSGADYRLIRELTA